MVEIPEPYVRQYPLSAVEREAIMDLFYLFRATPLPGLALSANIVTRGSTYILEDGSGDGGMEQELLDLVRNRDKIITGFNLQAAQRVEAPPPLISVSLRLARDAASLRVISPRGASRNDQFALDGLEEGIGKILAKTPRQSDKILDSPYTMMIAALASGIIASRMPLANLEPVSVGVIAAALIVTLWLANKYRAYKTCHVVFVARDDEDLLQHFSRTIKKYSREIIGGVITLCISLIVLFITWFFHLA